MISLKSPREIDIMSRGGAILACPGLGVAPDPGLDIAFSATSLVAARMRDPARHDDPGA